MTEVTSYTREECIPKLICPKGVEYAVFQSTENPQLFEVRAVLKDEFDKPKPDMRRQQPVEGWFTGSGRAETALNRWLTIQWDASDAAKAKNERKREAA